MKRAILFALMATTCSPVLAQESQHFCAEIAPHMRELAVEARKTLGLARELVPEGVESDAMMGTLDVAELKAGATSALPLGTPDEAIEGMMAAATILPSLEPATRTYEVAASALEACASKQSVE